MCRNQLPHVKHFVHSFNLLIDQFDLLSTLLVQIFLEEREDVYKFLTERQSKTLHHFKGALEVFVASRIGLIGQSIYEEILHQALSKVSFEDKSVEEAYQEN